MNAKMSAAALLAAATVTVPAAPALASADEVAGGCVSNAAHARIGIGQTLSYIRSVAGTDAMVGSRDWASGANAYKERLFALCTPIDSAHDTLTTRFMYYEGSWRAFLVDTHLGPEPR